MRTINSQVYHAFESAGARDDWALAAAGAIADQQRDVAELRGAVTLIEWIVGFNLAFSVALLLQLERLLMSSAIQPFRTAARSAPLACTHTCRGPHPRLAARRACGAACLPVSARSC